MNNYLQEGAILQKGRYKIVRYISSGGFGCTYEAEHVMLKKRVAIKEFFVKDFCNREDITSHVTVGTISKKGLVDKLKKKFVDEARAISALQHPGIVRVLDVFEENETAYYVMDYIDGLSLNDIVKKEGPMLETRAVEYIHQVAEALKYVHDNNRLHLDVKPANIMVNDEDHAILIDFGASKQYDEEGGENTSTLMGKTPGYAPPEQMGNDIVKFLPATDIYALGATLYKLLTGITPISSTLLVSGEKIAPLPKGTSQNVNDAVKASMQMSKTERPQTIAEFIEILCPTSDDETVLNYSSRGAEISPKKDAPQQVVPQEVKPASPPKQEKHPKEAKQKKEVKPKPASKPMSAKSKNRTIIISAFAVIVVFLVLIIFKFGHSKSKNVGEQAPEEVETVQKEVTVTKDSKMTYKGVTFTYSGPVNEQGNAQWRGKGVYAAGTYEGEYSNGCREGIGRFTTSDGRNEFEGTFKNDQYEQGRLIDKADGSYFSGTFKNNTPYTGTWYEKDGTAYCIIKDGKQI